MSLFRLLIPLYAFSLVYCIHVYSSAEIAYKTCKFYSSHPLSSRTWVRSPLYSAPIIHLITYLDRLYLCSCPAPERSSICHWLLLHYPGWYPFRQVPQAGHLHSRLHHNRNYWIRDLVYDRVCWCWLCWCSHRRYWYFPHYSLFARLGIK